jgi:hypothetical protein
MPRRASIIARRQAPMSKMRDSGKQAFGQRFPLPAPSLGMNTRDSISTLQQLECRSISNVICESGKVVIRPGKSEHQAVPAATSVRALFAHEGVAANVLLASGDGEIWDVTGTADQLSAGNYLSDRWSIAQMNDTAIGVNGVDTPWSFDGAVFGASGLSGVGLTIANLRTIHQVGDRLWYTERDRGRVWYGQPSQVTGVLEAFDLEQVTRGGYCVGVYDFRNSTVFVMSTGQIVTYQGDVETDFANNGDYEAPRPVGYDPGIKIGGDLVLMTAAGVAPFEALAAGVAWDTGALQHWGKNQPSWAADFERFGSLEGWNAEFSKGLAIFNVPTDATTSKQWVFNTRTKAWSYWDNLNAAQFAEFNGRLYFGGADAGEVYTNTGSTDLTEDVMAVCRGAFFLPFASQFNGQYTLARLNLLATGQVTARLQIDVEYVQSNFTAAEVPIASAGVGPWDEPWDGPWGQDGQAQLLWSGVAGYGCAVAPVWQINSRADRCEMLAFDIFGQQAAAVG